MPDRRETPRRSKRPSNRRRHSDSSRQEDPSWEDGERIAKYLARAGVASRREVEAMIERGEVRINGRVLRTPAFKVQGREDIRVNGKQVEAPDGVRLWRYHKPAGLITTTSDPAGRRTVFDELPKSLPRTVTVGRLDLATEGLLLLTNAGGLARALELPKTGLVRRYRARAHGEVTPEALSDLKAGITLGSGQTYAPIEAEVERQTGTNSWLNVALTEGKNREIRNAFAQVGLTVNRLIRTDYGPFQLESLKPGAVEEIPAPVIRKLLIEKVSEQYLPNAPQDKHGRHRKRSNRRGK